MALGHFCLARARKPATRGVADGVSHGRHGHAFAPRGVFGAFAGGVDGADADHPGPLAEAVNSIFLVVVSRAAHDDDAQGVCAGDRPLHGVARVSTCRRDADDLGTVSDRLIDQPLGLVERVAMVATAIGIGFVAVLWEGGAVGKERGVGSNAVLLGDQERGHGRPVALRVGTGGDSARCFVDDGGACQLGGAGVDLSVDERDGDALAGVAFRPRLIEVVVGEVGLLGRRDGVGGLCGSGGQGGGPGRQGQDHRTRTRKAQPPVSRWASRHLAW